MARCQRYVCIAIAFLVIVLIFLSGYMLSVSAVDSSATSKEILDYQAVFESQIFLQSSNHLSSDKKELQSVAVSDSGCYLLVYSGKASRYYIDVFDKEGQEINEIILREAGSIVAMFDASDNVVIYPFRRNIFICLNHRGEYLYAFHTELDKETLQMVDGSISSEKSVNDKRYVFSSNLFKKSFTLTTSQGETLYSCSSISSFLIVAIALICAIWASSWYEINKRKK